MKKITALAVALLLMFCAMSAVSAEELSGTWYLSIIVSDGVQMSASDIGAEMEMRLDEDGTAVIAYPDESGTGTWSASDDGVIVTIDGTDSAFTFMEGYLVAEEDGMTMAFGREKPAPSFVPAEEIAAESAEAFNGTYKAAYVAAFDATYPYETIADQLVMLIGAANDEIVIENGSVSALGREAEQFAFENGMLILAGEGEMAEYTTQTVKMLEDGSVVYSVMEMDIYCVGAENGAETEPEDAEDAGYLGAWTLESIASGDVVMDAEDSGMDMDIVITETEIIRTAYGETVSEGYTQENGTVTCESGAVYTFADGALTTESEGVTMIFAKTEEPDIFNETVYVFRVDSEYYTETDGVLGSEADNILTGEIQNDYGDAPYIEVPESEFDNYVLDESLSHLTAPAASEDGVDVYVAVFVRHVSEEEPDIFNETPYVFRVDSKYYTETNGVLGNEPDHIVTGETQNDYGDAPYIEVPESEYYDYELDESLSSLTAPAATEEGEDVYIAVFVKRVSEYTYRVDCAYYTEVNGIIGEEPDEYIEGEKMTTTDEWFCPAIPESALEGYEYDDFESEMFIESFDTAQENVFKAVFVKSVNEYTYRVDRAYYTEVNGMMSDEIDFAEEGELMTTTESKLAVTAPESEIEGYELNEELSELEMEFTDEYEEYVFNAVYVRSLTEYSYRVEGLYRVSVDGVIDATRDITAEVYESKTFENALTISAPESAEDGYVFDEAAEENVLSLSFDDETETYVFTAVYVKQESLFIGREFKAHAVVMGGRVLEDERAGGITIAFADDGTCLLTLMGREIEFTWTYADGIVTVDYFGEELVLVVSDDGTGASQIEADMAGYMTVLFEESK